MTKTNNKTYTKEFQCKGQMINYYTKVRRNNEIKYASCGYDVDRHAYTVSYRY